MNLILLLFLLSSCFINSYCADVSDGDLYEMIQNGKISNILNYINDGGNVDQKIFQKSLLCWATYYGQLEIAELLIMRGADINLQDEHLTTPLFYSILFGYNQLTRLLLQHKTDPNIKDTDGNTILYWAAFYDNDEMVKLLIERNAIINENELAQILNDPRVKPEIKQLLELYSNNHV